ncbi:MAG: hypothetical protein KY443_09670 [Actinobacteria bacterium]|nr:hypothetical protein [Actinomycetota bacterium]
MPTVFHADDASFYDDITPEHLKRAQAAARALGLEVGLVPLSTATEMGDYPLAMMLRMKPGAVLSRHCHDCYRVEVVVQGSIDVGNGRVLRPGDLAVSGPGEYYGPHTAGPAGSLSVEIFSSAAGMVPGFDDGTTNTVREQLLATLRGGD